MWADNGTRSWANDELEAVYDGFARVPAWDRHLLMSLTIVRDMVNPGSVTAEDPDEDPARLSEAYTHTGFNEQLDGDRLLGPPPHIHFFDTAFDLQDPQLEDQGWAELSHLRGSRVAVHEVGHLHVLHRIGTASNSFIDVGKRFDAARTAAEGAAGNLEDRLEDETVGQIYDLWWKHAAPACAAMDKAAEAVRALQYPLLGSPNSNPETAERLKLLQGAGQATSTLGKHFSGLRQVTRSPATLQLMAKMEEQLGSKDPTAVAIAQGCRDLHAKVVKLTRWLVCFWRAAARLAGAHRQLDRFTSLAVQDGFQPFTRYSGLAHDEWFADTYALAVLSPGRLARESPRIAAWFLAGLPGGPWELEDPA